MLSKCYLGPLGIEQQSLVEDDEDEDHEDDNKDAGIDIANKVTSSFSSLTLLKAKNALNDVKQEDEIDSIESK
jgi:hypothetical protein